MSDIPATPAAASAARPPVAGITVTAAPRPSLFHQLLTDLNPLQYLPVVGTIYRAVTGDVAPESLRTAGSMLVSGLLGGPVGLATSAASFVLEKITGFDVEQAGQDALAWLGIGRRAAPATARPAQAAAPATPVALAAPAAPPPASGWSETQLAAYGVVRTKGNGLRQGEVEGADVLNNLELSRLSQAAMAYNEAAPPPAPSVRFAA